MSEREERLKQLFLKGMGGDTPAYQAFLSEVSELLSRYLLQAMNPRLRSKEQVEDLVQEVLLSIHRKRDLYEVTLPVLPWVYAIARYRLIDSFRGQARRPELVLWVERFDQMALVSPPLFPDEESGDHLLDGLTEIQKTVVKLAKVDEIPLQEIAGKMGMSLTSVKVTIHRALKSLRSKN